MVREGIWLRLESKVNGFPRSERVNLDPWNMHTFFEQNCRILRQNRRNKALENVDDTGRCFYSFTSRKNIHLRYAVGLSLVAKI